jgi:hypothetical protein
MADHSCFYHVRIISLHYHHRNDGENYLIQITKEIQVKLIHSDLKEIMSYGRLL